MTFRSSRPWSARHHLPERAIDVPRNIGDAAPAEVAQVELARVGVRHARVDVFHRQVGIGRDQRQRRRKVARRPDVHAEDAVDDARRVFEALQHGVMRLRRCGSGSMLRYEFCIGPSMRPSNETPNTSARPKSFRCWPHSSYSEVANVATRLPPRLDVACRCGALRVGQRGRIGEDQHLELVEALGCQVAPRAPARRAAAPRSARDTCRARGRPRDRRSRHRGDTATSVPSRAARPCASGASLRRYRSCL